MKRLGALLASLLLAGSLTACGGAAAQEMHSVQFFAMDTVMGLQACGGETEAALAAAEDEIYRLDEALSRTREDSAVSRLNSAAAGTPVDVGEELHDLIARALDFSAATDGAFDITLAPVSSAWGFTEDAYRVPAQTELDALLAHVGAEHVHPEGEGSVSLDEGTRIDLGAIAKGYIADQMKEQLLDAGVASAIINLGGNVLCVGARPDETPFRIGIQRPFAERNEVAGALDIEDMSVVSSGVYERHFIQDGVNYHHLLNPRTGYPYENGLVQVTIISRDSVDGDGLSTTCFALGIEEGSELLESLEDTYGIFMTEDGETYYTEGAEQFLAPNE